MAVHYVNKVVLVCGKQAAGSAQVVVPDLCCHRRVAGHTDEIRVGRDLENTEEESATTIGAADI